MCCQRANPRATQVLSSTHVRVTQWSTGAAAVPCRCMLPPCTAFGAGRAGCTLCPQFPDPQLPRSTQTDRIQQGCLRQAGSASCMLHQWCAASCMRHLWCATSRMLHQWCTVNLMLHQWCTAPAWPVPRPLQAAPNPVSPGLGPFEGARPAAPRGGLPDGCCAPHAKHLPAHHYQGQVWRGMHVRI